LPASTDAYPNVPLDTVFHRSFSLESVPTSAILRIRAFRECTIQLNGKPVPVETDSGSWKRESSLEVAQFLQSGQNELIVKVTNSSAPPALWLTLSASDVFLITDHFWQASLVGATLLPAALAADPVPFGSFDRDGLAERVVPSVLKIWPMWLIFAGTSFMIILLSRLWLETPSPGVPLLRRSSAEVKHGPLLSVRQAILHFIDPPVPNGRWLGITRVAFALIAIFWTVLFIHNSQYLFYSYGFDIDGFLGYINHFRSSWSIPMPGQGRQMHHPPLYPFMAAALLNILGYAPETPNGILTVRLLNLALALINLSAILACLRLIFPDHPRRWIIGLLIAGFLPMHVYLYHYPTNHILAGTMASVILYFTFRILCATSTRMLDYAFLGLAMGFGLLSMVTVGLIIVPALAAIAIKLYLDRSRISWTQAFLRIFVLAAISLCTCGWYYAMVWIHCGRLLAVDMGAMTPTKAVFLSWWQDPGFRTTGNYLRFGESLSSPLFSVWYSVWDGLYSTLWGDSYMAGFPALDIRPPWAYQFMAAGMILAILPTLAIFIGLGVMVCRYLRKPTIIWTLLFGVAFLIAMFLIYGVIALPCYSSVKAFYGLPAVVPLCALAALGLDLLTSRWRWFRMAIFIFIGVWSLNVAATYWISPASLETRRSLAVQLFLQGNIASSKEIFEQLHAEYPDDARTQILLAQLYLNQNRTVLARETLEDNSHNRDSASRHYYLGKIANKEGRTANALAEFNMAMQMAPNDLEIAQAYTKLLLATGPDLQAAINACRNVLRINPFHYEFHATLSRLYLNSGNQQSANLHHDYWRSIRKYFDAHTVP
jgi:hypothetical protein